MKKYASSIRPVLKCIFIIISNAIFAQGIHIQVNIQDIQHTPIEIGNVLLLSPRDSTVLDGDLFYDGKVKLSTNYSGEALFKITALGYTDYYQRIQLEKTDLNLGIIRLERYTLNEVTVLGRSQIAEQKGGTLVVNIENTALENIGSAMDVLRNTPKVNLARGNQVEVVGKGTALIYLDGQLITSVELLNSLISSDLKTIEVIENPSAKYDAAGQAIINIQTKKKTLEGFKIGLTQEVGKGRFGRSLTNIDSYYRTGKFLFQAAYGYNPAKFWMINEYGRTYEHLGNNVEIDNTYPVHYFRKKHQYNFKTLFQLSEKSEIGLNYTGNSTDGDREGNSRNRYFENEVLLSKINVENNGPYQQQNNIYHLYYNHQLNEKGASLSAAAQHADYYFERFENIYQVVERANSFSESNLRTTNKNDIQVRSLQLDYSNPLSSKLTLESGFKVANILNGSLLNFEDLEEDGTYTSFALFSTDYEYEENILALYSQVTWKNEKVSANFGLRGEWTMNEGLAVKENGENMVENNYKNLFPSASIQTTLNENLKAGLSYNYRIQRPAFQDLNPFTVFADSLVSFRGNPLLQPEYGHNLSANLAIKSFNISLNYNYTKDKINTIVILPNEETPAIFDFFRDNTIGTRLYAVNLSFPLQNKWHSSYTTLTARLDDHRFFDRDVARSNVRAGYNIRSNHTFYLPKDFTLELYLQYASPRVDGLYTDSSVSAVSFGISRKFLNNALTARLFANDIFRGYQFQGTYDVYDNEWTYLNAGDFRFVRFSLNWNFGKLGTSKLHNKHLKDSELNRINWQ
ncbi:MAG: outer membrane beta-barrel family protein [Bacteroidota bacterium]